MALPVDVDLENLIKHVDNVGYSVACNKAALCGICGKNQECRCLAKFVRVTIDLEQIATNTVDLPHRLVDNSADPNNDDFYIACDKCKFWIYGTEDFTIEEAEKFENWYCKDCLAGDKKLRNRRYSAKKLRKLAKKLKTGRSSSASTSLPPSKKDRSTSIESHGTNATVSDTQKEPSAISRIEPRKSRAKRKNDTDSDATSSVGDSSSFSGGSSQPMQRTLRPRGKLNTPSRSSYSLRRVMPRTRQNVGASNLLSRPARKATVHVKETTSDGSEYGSTITASSSDQSVESHQSSPSLSASVLPACEVPLETDRSVAATDDISDLFNPDDASHKLPSKTDIHSASKTTNVKFVSLLKKRKEPETREDSDTDSEADCDTESTGNVACRISEDTVKTIGSSFLDKLLTRKVPVPVMPSKDRELRPRKTLVVPRRVIRGSLSGQRSKLRKELVAKSRSSKIEIAAPVSGIEAEFPPALPVPHGIKSPEIPLEVVGQLPPALSVASVTGYFSSAPESVSSRLGNLLSRKGGSNLGWNPQTSGSFTASSMACSLMDSSEISITSGSRGGPDNNRLIYQPSVSDGAMQQHLTVPGSSISASSSTSAVASGSGSSELPGCSSMGMSQPQASSTDNQLPVAPVPTNENSEEHPSDEVTEMECYYYAGPQQTGGIEWGEDDDEPPPGLLESFTAAVPVHPNLDPEQMRKLFQIDEEFKAAHKALLKSIHAVLPETSDQMLMDLMLDPKQMEECALVVGMIAALPEDD